MEDKIEEILNIARNSDILSITQLEEKGYEIDKIFEGHIQERRKLNIYLRDNIRKNNSER